MNKSDIVKGLASGSDLTAPQVGEVVDRFLNAIVMSLWDGEDVMLTGFGKFALRDRPDTKRRNPRTGEMMDIPAKTMVAFLLSPVVRTKLNEDLELVPVLDVA